MSIEKYEAERARHFDPARSSVSNWAQFEDELAEIFPTGVSEISLILMAGAPTGSTLTLSAVVRAKIPPGPYDPSDKGEITPASLMVTVSNDYYLHEANSVTFYKAPLGKRGIYINLVMFKPGIATAIGGLMIKTILEGIASLGQGAQAFKRLRMMAAGGRRWGDMKGGGRWSGYKSWPRYGFDMKVRKPTVDMYPHFRKYPKGLARCATLNSLLALKGGPEFWEVVGDGLYMTFELDKNVAKERLDKELRGRFS